MVKSDRRSTALSVRNAATNQGTDRSRQQDPPLAPPTVFGSGQRLYRTPGALSGAKDGHQEVARRGPSGEQGEDERQVRRHDQGREGGVLGQRRRPVDSHSQFISSQHLPIQLAITCHHACAIHAVSHVFRATAMVPAQLHLLYASGP